VSVKERMKFNSTRYWIMGYWRYWRVSAVHATVLGCTIPWSCTVMLRESERTGMGVLLLRGPPDAKRTSQTLVAVR